MTDCKHDWHFVQGLTERLRCTRCGLMTWPKDAELRRLHEVEVAYGVMMAKAESRIAELQHALEWISRRCPAQFLEQEPHRIHWEAAYDAGACARAALDRAGGAP